jgi:hypothetical protein
LMIAVMSPGVFPDDSPPIVSGGGG